MEEDSRARQILEWWEQGKTQYEIARLSGSSLYTVKMLIHRYQSLAAFDASLPLNNDPKPRTYIIVRNDHAKRSYTDQQLSDAVAESFSIAGVLRKLHLRPAGGNYELVKRRIQELGLSTTHFTGKQWLKGKRNHTTRKRSLQDILVKESTYTTTSDLKRRLLAEGLFERVCSACGLTEWQGQPIPLEIDHINGARRDNRLENLRLLCPNCHALTMTYRGKNKRPIAASK